MYNLFAFAIGVRLLALSFLFCVYGNLLFAKLER